MDFKEATDDLFARVDHEDLAKRLGVSVATIRQARLRPDAGAHRSPPNGWRDAVAKLARDSAQRYQQLADALAPGERDHPDSYLQPKHHEESMA
jgi:hypothetical protein